MTKAIALIVLVLIAAVVVFQYLEYKQSKQQWNQKLIDATIAINDMQRDNERLTTSNMTLEGQLVTVQENLALKNEIVADLLIRLSQRERDYKVLRASLPKPETETERKYEIALQECETISASKDVIIAEQKLTITLHQQALKICEAQKENYKKMWLNEKNICTSKIKIIEHDCRQQCKKKEKIYQIVSAIAGGIIIATVLN